MRSLDCGDSQGGRSLRVSAGLVRLNSLSQTVDSSLSEGPEPCDLGLWGGCLPACLPACPDRVPACLPACPDRVPACLPACLPARTGCPDRVHLIGIRPGQWIRQGKGVEGAGLGRGLGASRNSRSAFLAQSKDTPSWIVSWFFSRSNSSRRFRVFVEYVVKLPRGSST
jgi:hypothetical protein